MLFAAKTRSIYGIVQRHGTSPDDTHIRLHKYLFAVIDVLSDWLCAVSHELQPEI